MKSGNQFSCFWTKPIKNIVNLSTFLESLALLQLRLQQKWHQSMCKPDCVNIDSRSINHMAVTK